VERALPVTGHHVVGCRGHHRPVRPEAGGFGQVLGQIQGIFGHQQYAEAFFRLRGHADRQEIQGLFQQFRRDPGQGFKHLPAQICHGLSLPGQFFGKKLAVPEPVGPEKIRQDQILVALFFQHFPKGQYRVPVTGCRQKGCGLIPDRIRGQGLKPFPFFISVPLFLLVFFLSDFGHTANAIPLSACRSE